MAVLVEVFEAVPRAKSEQGREALGGRGREALRTRVPSYSLHDLARGGGWCEAPSAYAGRRDIDALARTITAKPITSYTTDGIGGLAKILLLCVCSVCDCLYFLPLAS